MDPAELTEQVRAIAREYVTSAPIDERRMFGSDAVFVGGNLAVAPSTRGLMVRVDPEQHDALLDPPSIDTQVMRGRPMRGWIRIELDTCSDAALVEEWVRRGLDYAGTLPPK